MAAIAYRTRTQTCVLVIQNNKGQAKQDIERLPLPVGIEPKRSLGAVDKSLGAVECRSTLQTVVKTVRLNMRGYPRHGAVLGLVDSASRSPHPGKSDARTV